MAKKQFDNTNRGMLWRVREKKSDKHPDLNGKLNIDGTDYWCSGWWQPYTDSQTGEKRTGVSIAIGEPVGSKSQVKRVEAQSGGGEPAKRSTNFDDLQEDIPF